MYYTIRHKYAIVNSIIYYSIYIYKTWDVAQWEVGCGSVIVRRSLKDGYSWTCKHCNRYLRKFSYISIRKKSFFSNSNLPLARHVMIIHAWSKGSRICDYANELNLSANSLGQHFIHLREVCKYCLWILEWVVQVL